MIRQNQLNRVGAKVAAATLRGATETIRIERRTLDSFGAVDPTTGLPGETITIVQPDTPAIVVSTATGSSSDTARTVLDSAWLDLDTIAVRCSPEIIRPDVGDTVVIVASADPNLEGRTARVLGVLTPGRWYSRFVAELVTP